MRPSAHIIILFGSYARNEWQEETYTEGHITYEYISDFDILVLTRLKKTAHNHANQSRVDNSIVLHKAVKTPVSVIYHSVGQVNYRLKQGQYFFSDIKKEGISLYDTGRMKLERRRKLSPAKRKQITEEDFKMWFKSAQYLKLNVSATEKPFFVMAVFCPKQQLQNLLQPVFNRYPKTIPVMSWKLLCMSYCPDHKIIYPVRGLHSKYLSNLLPFTTMSSSKNPAT